MNGKETTQEHSEERHHVFVRLPGIHGADGQNPMIGKSQF